MLQFLNYIVDTDEVFAPSVRGLRSAVFFRWLILRNASDLIKEGNGVSSGSHVQDQVNLALLHNRISINTDTSIHKKFADIAEPTRILINQITAFRQRESGGDTPQLRAIRAQRFGMSFVWVFLDCQDHYLKKRSATSVFCAGCKIGTTH